MSKTIEERLAELAAALYYYDQGDQNEEEHERITCAIIADWNAAMEALKDAHSQLVGIESVCADCYNRDLAFDEFLDNYMPEILRGKLETAIAQMESSSPSRDEAMVEDKRYERDDIFKK